MSQNRQTLTTNIISLKSRRTSLVTYLLTKITGLAFVSINDKIHN